MSATSAVGTPTSKVFEYKLDGLSFTITVEQNSTGDFMAANQVHEGHADFNALYLSGADGTADRVIRLPKGDKSLNLNGATHEGNPAVWDDMTRLSGMGLAREGKGKDTFVTAEETERFELAGVTSFEELAFLGVRATSTSTAGGSVKAVEDGTVTYLTPNDFPDMEGFNKLLTLAFKHPEGAGDGFYNVQVVPSYSAGFGDLDDYFARIVSGLVARDDVVAAALAADPNAFLRVSEFRGPFYQAGAANTNGTAENLRPYDGAMKLCAAQNSA